MEWIRVPINPEWGLYRSRGEGEYGGALATRVSVKRFERSCGCRKLEGKLMGELPAAPTLWRSAVLLCRRTQ